METPARSGMREHQPGRTEQMADRALMLLRVVAAILFFQHGLQKWLGWPPGGHAPADWSLLSIWAVAAALEFGGSILVFLGLFTRPVAFVLCGDMAFAYWFIHVPGAAAQPAGWMPAVNGGDLAILFCFVFLYLVAAGPGSLSLDHWLSARKGRCPP